MKVTVTTPPESLPFTTDEIARHLRIDIGSGSDVDEDQTSYLEWLGRVAADYAQVSMDCSLMEQTLTGVYYDNEKMWLRRGPVTEITSITDDDGDLITDYDLKQYGNLQQIVVNESYKAPLTVIYKAGHEEAGDINPSIVHAMLCHIGTLYENRESAVETSLQPVPDSLAAFYRMHRRSLGIG